MPYSDNSLDNSPGPRSKFQQLRYLNLCSGLPMLLANQLRVLLEGVGCNFDEVQVALCHYPFHTANHQTPLKTEKKTFLIENLRLLTIDFFKICIAIRSDASVEFSQKAPLATHL